MKRLLLTGAGALALCVAAALSPLNAQTLSPDPRLTPAPGIALDTDFLIGLWADDRDCTKAIDLRRNGVFTSYTGGQGTWRLEGDMLTLSGAATMTVRIVPRTQQEIVIVNPDGTIGNSHRCPDTLSPHDGK